MNVNSPWESAVITATGSKWWHRSSRLGCRTLSTIADGFMKNMKIF